MSAFYEFISSHAAILSLAVTTVSGFATAFLYKSKHDVMAKVARAGFVGMGKGVEEIAAGKDPRAALIDAVTAAARDLGVQDHVQDHVDEHLVVDQAPPRRIS